MRKRIIAPVQKGTASPDENWLNLDGLAEVEITSEDAAHKIEFALLPGAPRAVRRTARTADDPASLHPSATASANIAEVRRARH